MGEIARRPSFVVAVRDGRLSVTEGVGLVNPLSRFVGSTRLSMEVSWDAEGTGN